MNLLNPRLLIIAGLMAFVLGLSSPYIKEWFIPTNTPTIAEQDTAPITSDAFTFRLLKAALAHQPEGNLTLAPNSLAAALHQVSYLAEPSVEKSLQALPLPEKLQQSNILPKETACLFADTAAGLNPEYIPDVAIAAPFSTDLPEAFKTINTTLSLLTATPPGNLANSETVSNSTNILMVNFIDYTAGWSSAISPAESSAEDFYNANGRMPKVRMMSAHASHFATDPHGKWSAAAIRLAKDGAKAAGLPDCYVIVILPEKATAARNFAAELTTEQFSAIRTALRESTRSCTLTWPRLSFRSTPQDITGMLKLLEIDPLFTTANPLTKLTAKPVFPFTAAYQQCSVTMKESPVPGSNSAPTPEEKLLCDRPFLWFIMPISSPAPPYAMGIVENL